MHTSTPEIVNLLEHLVGGGDHPRIRFVGTLRQDHLDELFHHVHVRAFEHTLLNFAQALGSAGSADNRIARGRGHEKQVLANAVEPAGIRKKCKLNLSHLLRRGLAGLRHADGAIGPDGDGGGPGGNRDTRLQWIPIGGHDVALRVQMKCAAARVGDVAGGQADLKNPWPLMVRSSGLPVVLKSPCSWMTSEAAVRVPRPTCKPATMVVCWVAAAP